MEEKILQPLNLTSWRPDLQTAGTSSHDSSTCTFSSLRGRRFNPRELKDTGGGPPSGCEPPFERLCHTQAQKNAGDFRLTFLASATFITTYWEYPCVC